MIQILKLRKWIDKQTGKERGTDKLFDPPIEAKNFRDLMENIDAYVSQIKLSERWNCYYTSFQSTAAKRNFVKQFIIPFDIDKADVEKPWQDYGKIVATALGVPLENLYVIFSGNGFHFIIELKIAFESEQFYADTRDHYKNICTKITAGLEKAGLPGKADPAVWSRSRVLRLPNTENRKKERETRMSTLCQLGVAIDFDLKKASGVVEIAPSDQIEVAEFARYPKPDTQAVLEGCEFLKHMKENQNEVTEDEWYSGLSILGRLENGNLLAHSYSNEHAGYSHAECEGKIEQALGASGPRTCRNIDSKWGKCSGCRFYGKIKSPILIRGAGFIATEHTGFYNEIFEKGKVKRVPNYDDLEKFFFKKHPYKVMQDSGICFRFNGKFFEPMLDLEIKAFAENNFDPKPLEYIAVEFLKKVLRNNLVPASWFTDSTMRRMNFQNGVLDLDTMELKEHSMEFGFTSVLPYAYDAMAKAPMFEKFLDDITGGKKDFQNLLLEFAGYCFSNDACNYDKALIMTGEGSNGKSTFLRIIKALAGKNNVSHLTLKDLNSEVNRQALEGKLFNIGEETPMYSVVDSSGFKNLITGGTTRIKTLYKQPYEIENRTKFMFACNELPVATDSTKAFIRRWLIVPFNVLFDASNRDRFIHKKLLNELPGVLNLVLKGYQRLKDQDEFTVSPEVYAALEAYRMEIDTVAQWVETEVEVSDNVVEGGVSLERLYQNYRLYTKEHEYKPLTFIPFVKGLKRNVNLYDARRWRTKRAKKDITIIRGLTICEDVAMHQY